MPHVPADGPIRAHFEANWTGPERVVFENQQPAEPWPPVDGDLVLQPWAMLETVGTGSELAGGSGTPGNRLWTDFGLIYFHAFIPVGEQESRAVAMAHRAGDIFRAAAFFDGPDGRRIRTLAPRVTGGGSATDGDDWFLVKGTNGDHGQWFRVSMSVEFTYWYRA